MTLHTPGPWNWGYTTVNTGTGALAGDLQLRTLMPNPRLNDPVILTVREDWKAYLTRSDEGQANARLIAAAPDLLAALQALSNYTADLQDLDETEVRLLAAATAAIAKATGL